MNMSNDIGYMNVSKTLPRKLGLDFKIEVVIFHNLETRFGVSSVLRSNLKSNYASKEIIDLLSIKSGYIPAISTLNQIISEKRQYGKALSVLSKEKEISQD